MRDPGSGATTPTELRATLDRAGVTSIVVCGLATDYCVKATALDGVGLGYPTTVLVDAIRAVNLKPGEGDRAVAEMAGAGVVLARGASAADSQTVD